MTHSNSPFRSVLEKNRILESSIGRFRWHEPWVTFPDGLNADYTGKTHGVAASRAGLVIVFRQSIPSVLVYNQNSQLIDSWGEYPGAHGLTLVEKDGVESLWLTDEKIGIVENRTFNGLLMQSLVQPPHPLYQSHKYRPTWVAENETRFGGNGDLWIADGYGAHLIHRFNAAGDYLQTIDGSEGIGRFNCPHGIWFDSRKSPSELYVADRNNRRVAVYDAEGIFQRSFGPDFMTSPDGFANFGDILIVPELMGCVAILDGQDRLTDRLGVNTDVCGLPGWPNDTPIEVGKFSSPHAAAVDAAGNIYVVEWRHGGRVIKLEKL